MPLLETLPVGPDTAQWSVWGTTARIVVADQRALTAARTAVEGELARIDQVCSRFRPDSEINAVCAQAGPIRISPLLADFLAASLESARISEGAVDPTVGAALAELGYDLDLAALPPDGPPVRVSLTRVPGWEQVRLDGHILNMPSGIQLDLGATAKAHAADRCARLVYERTGSGALVALGGDIATAGRGPTRGWRILVQDRPGDPRCTVAIPGGAALATSSTRSRNWRRGGRSLHHILDPWTGQPAEPVWRSASVAAHTCLMANTLTTAALVRGLPAVEWLRARRLPARLVAANGSVVTIGGWPREES